MSHSDDLGDRVRELEREVKEIRQLVAGDKHTAGRHGLDGKIEDLERDIRNLKDRRIDELERKVERLTNELDKIRRSGRGP